MLLKKRSVRLCPRILTLLKSLHKKSGNNSDRKQDPHTQC